MAIYNTFAGVIEMIEATSPEDAVEKLTERLERAGFAVFEGHGDTAPNAFESDINK